MLLSAAAAASVYSCCWETMKIEISSVSIGEGERERKEGKMPAIYSYVWVPVHWSVGNSNSNSSLASGLSSILDLAQLNWADLVVARPRRQSQWQPQQYLSIQKEKNKPNFSVSFAANCRLQMLCPVNCCTQASVCTDNADRQTIGRLYFAARLNAWSPNDYYCYLQQQQQQQQPH